MPYGDGKCMARIDFKDSKDVDEVELDDVCTIVIKGKVKALRGPEERKERDYPIDGKKKARERNLLIPGCLEMEIETCHVGKPSEWEDAAEKMEEDE